MTEKIIKPIPITKENFAKYGDMISTKDIKPLEINNGYAKRYDGIANLNTSSDNGETTISIFSALKRNFPMKINMMEKHPLGSQAFIPMKETTFLVFVAPNEEKLDLNKIEAFIIPPGVGVNYNPGTWHFPLISTEDMNFLVVDRKGSGDNGETTISIFSALKRNFPMKIDMMEKHPLGSQAFIPMKETTFLVFVAPNEEKLDLNKIEAFIIPPGIGVNYNPGTWHFPLISTEDMNFLVVDRKGSGDNLVIENLDKENITLKY